MKVILTQDVAKLGRRHSIVTVPDGRGLNQLIPQGLALPATPENLKRIAFQKAKAADVAALDQRQFAAAVAILHDTVPTITAKANQQGHLFEAIKPAQIAEALKAAGITLAVEHIATPTPVKSVGSHMVHLMNGEVVHPVTIEVVAA
jgi:large subunit ribosomal protein L9